MKDMVPPYTTQTRLSMLIFAYFSRRSFESRHDDLSSQGAWRECGGCSLLLLLHEKFSRRKKSGALDGLAFFEGNNNNNSHNPSGCNNPTSVRWSTARTHEAGGLACPRTRKLV
ncbi:unnamed protein product [Ectocarpus sp. 13 AM-2016]